MVRFFHVLDASEPVFPVLPYGGLGFQSFAKSLYGAGKIPVVDKLVYVLSEDFFGFSHGNFLALGVPYGKKAYNIGTPRPTGCGSNCLGILGSLKDLSEHSFYILVIDRTELMVVIVVPHRGWGAAERHQCAVRHRPMAIDQRPKVVGIGSQVLWS